VKLTYALLALGVAMGCANDPPTNGVSITAADPPFGPLVGGTRITLVGSGFLTNGAAPNRVVIGNREAPQAGVIDDNHLEVSIPPGELPGDVPIIVFNRLGQATATGIFKYSTTPVVTTVTPNDVLYTALATTMTIEGSGFADEGAGFTRVLVDGVPAVDVEILSDTQLKFTAPPGVPLSRPAISIVNDRGVGASSGFRYVPSTRKGLLLFGRGDNFFIYFDPVDQSTVAVPRKPSAQPFIPRSVVAYEGGYLGSALNDSKLGLIDVATQQLIDPVTTIEQFPAMVNSNGTIYAISRNRRQFGVVDPTTGVFSARGPSMDNCCGSFGLAVTAAGALNISFVDASNSITTVTDQGVRGTSIPLAGTGSTHVREMRYLDGTLYAVMGQNSVGPTNLVTVNPTTGAIATIATFNEGIPAMEVFQ